MNYKLISFRTTGNETVGKLNFFEEGRDIDFPIRRVYYISGVPVGMERGRHAHKKLRQLLFCPYGAIRITLDDGVNREEVLLDEANKGLIVEPECWHTMRWETEGSVLCVAASDVYKEADYIRNYDDFLSYLKRKA